MVKWLSSPAPLRRPRISQFGSCMGNYPTHAVAASHIEELESPTTRIYNYVMGLWEGKNNRGRLETDVSSGPIFLKKKKKKADDGSFQPKKQKRKNM